MKLLRTKTKSTDSCPLICLQCKKHVKAYAAIEVGVRQTDDEKMLKCSGFIDLLWRDSHSYSHAPVLTWEKQKHFLCCFCSTKCLRTFFNACVDKLEARIKKTRTRKNE